MKIGEGKYKKGRNLYLPKSIALALNIVFGESIEFHTDGEKIYLIKKKE